jgi:cbb3-type cytochrome oxidase maturation protein
VLLAIAVFALLWAIKHGQFDDLETHGWSVVLDDDQKPPPTVVDARSDADEKEVR